MNDLKKLSRRADKIATIRSEYFNKFIGYHVADNSNDEKAQYPSGWYGYTPDEAMQLADKVVAWLYSPLKED